MSENAGSLERIVIEFSKILSPLKDNLVSGRASIFFAQLGVPLTAAQEASLAAPFNTSVNNTLQFIDSAVAIMSDIDAKNYLSAAKKGLEALPKAAAVINSFTSIGTAVGSMGLPGVTPAVAGKIPERILHYLLASYIERADGVSQLLEFLGILEKTDFNQSSTDPGKPPFTINTFHFDRIVQWISNPANQLKQLYDWGSPSFDGSKLFSVLEKILIQSNIPVIYEEAASPPKLDLLLFELQRSTNSGLLIRLKSTVTSGVQTLSLGDIKIEFKADFALPFNTSILFEPNGNVTIQAPAAGSPLSGQVLVKLTAKRETPPGPFILFGQANASRLEAGEFIAKTGVQFAPSGNNYILEGNINKCKIVIDAGSGDGFLSKILPGTKFEAGFDLLLGVSLNRGFYFGGSSTLEVRLPVHIDLGPVSIEGLTIKAVPVKGEIAVNAGADIKVSLGALVAVVQNIGVTTVFSFPSGGGNIGPLQFGIKFKPPEGVGLSIDAGVVKGGGFLRFDVNKEEYTGVLELSILAVVTVKAIGLITTKMPDGSKGFSLLIIITAEFATGIQLGFGFTLLGVGGLLGLNRTMLLEPLAAGVKTGAVNSIMFPPDPVANAPRIISDLRTYFPPYEGKFLIGPMIKIGWGTPTLVKLSFGMIIEIPGNIAIVGILKVALPIEDAALIVINVAFLGAVEFDKKRIWFFASMYDSRMLFMTMEGDMGLLMDYGDNPNFVLSVGGFHPQFAPPPLPFPNPRRIHIDVLRNPLQRITVENYFAVTTNTVQFGASAELFYGIDDFNLHGNFSFDALFQFSPFHFIIEISFSVGLDVFGAGVFSVNLRFSLAGPGPFRAQGTATLSIDLWLFSIDISVDFDITWGEADNPKLPSIEAIPLLIAEYKKADNWRAELPKSSNLFVSLRKFDSVADGMVMHPLGTLQVSQRAVPLGINIDKLGNNPVSDAHLFSLGVNTAGLAKTKSIKEKFAIAQFQNLGDAQKLSSPAFQDIDSGLELSAAGKQLGSGKVVKRVVRYEVKIIDGYKRNRFGWFKNIGTLFFHWLSGAAVARSPLSYARKIALVPTSEDDRIKMKQPGYVIAAVADNKLKAGTAAFSSEAHARDYYNTAVAANSAMADEIHVIPAFEAN